MIINIIEIVLKEVRQVTMHNGTRDTSWAETFEACVSSSDIIIDYSERVSQVAKTILRISFSKKSNAVVVKVNGLLEALNFVGGRIHG